MIQSPIFKYRGLRIVSSYAGQGTADTIYITEDGARWTSNAMMSLTYSGSTAPERRGTIVDGYIR